MSEAMGWIYRKSDTTMVVSINRYLIVKYKTSCPNQSWNKELIAQKLTFYNIFTNILRKKIPINKENVSQNMFPKIKIDHRSHCWYTICWYFRYFNLLFRYKVE